MMTRKDITNEEELKAWADEPEEEILAKNDVASVAAEALERISGHLGEKNYDCMQLHSDSRVSEQQS